MAALPALICCERCGVHVTRERWLAALKTCVHCGYHYRIAPHDRIGFHLDAGSFVPNAQPLQTTDPLAWVDKGKPYPDTVASARRKTGLVESVLTGTARIDGREILVGVFDFGFMGGTLGSVTGEYLVRLLERGCQTHQPIILFTMSGGARMQEGMHSLMQMAKIAVALRRYQDMGGLLITVLCDPTTGGVAASIGFMGDVIVAEPGALVGFAGPRVIVEAIGQDLPDGFQSSEHRVAQGLVDMVVPRSQLRDVLRRCLSSAQLPSV